MYLVNNRCNICLAKSLLMRMPFPCNGNCETYWFKWLPLPSAANHASTNWVFCTNGNTFPSLSQYLYRMHLLCFLRRGVTIYLHINAISNLSQPTSLDMVLLARLCMCGVMTTPFVHSIAARISPGLTLNLVNLGICLILFLNWVSMFPLTRRMHKPRGRNSSWCQIFQSSNCWC